MPTLIKKFEANPTLDNAKRLIAYNRKHPFACLMMSDAQLDVYAKAFAMVHPKTAEQVL